MKQFSITILIILAFQLANAQTTPEPPTPPAPPASENYTTSVRSSSSKESTSVSVSQTDDDYKFKARFPKNRYAKLKNLIEKTLGGKNMDIGSGYSKWSDDKKVYYIKLTERNLRMSVDLNVASPDLVEKFKALGNDAKIIISGSTAKMEQERMQREADRKRRETERMKREVERLEREYERNVARIKRQAEREEARVMRERAHIKRDAERIEREARRMEREAKRLEEQARHKGGVSSYIKRLLEDSKTKYTATSGSNLNWIWPEVQENLEASLRKDKLITTTSEITFTKEKDRMYVNGKELSQAKQNTYGRMFQKAGIQSNADFSFYKKDDHIVIIGHNAKIKKVFNDLYQKGFIGSTDEAVKLLIDGNSITQNGQKLTATQVAAYNAILRDNGIIPAPGKYIEMKKAGSYRLGYSLENNGIVGTWIEENR